MPKMINCVFNERNAWCKHPQVKKSWFGFGARCCLEFDNKKCSCKEKYRPSFEFATTEANYKIIEYELAVVGNFPPERIKHAIAKGMLQEIEKLITVVDVDNSERQDPVIIKLGTLKVLIPKE